MLKKRHQIGEGLMKGRGVLVGRLHEEVALAVNERVGGFVRDDVVRKAGEHGLAREVESRIGHRRREVAEE